MANNHLHRLKLKHLSFMAILCKKNQIAKIFCRPDTDLNLPEKSGRPPFSSPPGCSRKNVAKYFRDTPTLVQASSSIGRCQGGGVTCETVLGQACWSCWWRWSRAQRSSSGPVTAPTLSSQHWPQHCNLCHVLQNSKQRG